MIPLATAVETSWLHACTIATLSRLAEVQVLVDSFREHHPNSTFTVLVIDDDQHRHRPEIQGADVLLLDEIGLNDRDRLVMSACYDADELAGAVKPWLLLALLDGPGEHAIYLDPDILVTHELSGLPELTRDGSIVLTPYLTEPMPRDGRRPSEQDILLMGAYNVGFVAVGDGENARRMLTWWQARLRTEASDDREHGLYIDQRWIDLVPSLFDHHIVRDPSWNVAYWNLATRPLTREGGNVLVAGRPLVFFHFAGYSPTTPYLLSAHHADNPRVRLSRDPVLRNLCDDYASRLVAAGHDPVPADHHPPFSCFDGLHLDSVMRKLVLAEMSAQEYGQGTGLDLASGAAALREWLLGGHDHASGPRAMARYLAALWASRPDLHAVYPDVSAGDPSGFLDWCELFGVDELGLARWPIDALREQYSPAPILGGVTADAAPLAGMRLVAGVEVVGFLSADLGIGQAARMLVAGLESAGEEVSTTTYTRTSSRLGAPWVDRPRPRDGRHDIAVVCINADMLPIYMDEDGGAEWLADRYLVGFWFWELDDFPPGFRPALEHLDEIWVTSDFTADVLREVTDIPVHTLPLPVHAPRDSGTNIPEIVADGTFTFLFVFDYFSVLERKNPLGLIEAFRRAFPQPGEARLIIKTINADKRAVQQERLRYAARDRPDIVLVERYLSRGELDGLMWAADCYVSLHRSEGFGFTMAEAMAIGKPVIATGYSGNLTFMSPHNSRLVDYAMVQVPPGCEPYPVTSTWAKPRLPHAARLMKRICRDADLRERLAVRAAADIAKHHSVDALADFARGRLPEIRRERAAARHPLSRLAAASRRKLHPFRPRQ